MRVKQLSSPIKQYCAVEIFLTKEEVQFFDLILTRIKDGDLILGRDVFYYQEKQEQLTKFQHYLRLIVKTSLTGGECSTNDSDSNV